MEFSGEKVSSLAGHTEYRQKEKKPAGEEESPEFVVVSAKMGIQFRGVSTWIGDRESLEKFAQAVGKAWEEHLKLKPSLTNH